MADIVKLDGIAVANFSKVNGIAKASLSKVLGQTIPSASYTSVNSIAFDGTNDYAETSGLTIPTAAGSVSLWFKFGTTTSTNVLFAWHNYGTTSALDEYFDIRLQNNSNNPAARGLMAIYRGNSTNQSISVKSSSSHHGTGFSRWKYNYDGVGSGTTWPHFEYNANKLIAAGSHSYSPSEGSEHGWHHVVVTWDVSESYTGKDAQSSHKYRPTASHDGSTTNHTGTMRIYMDGTLRNFGQSLFPSFNYQRTPSGMTEITGTVNEVRVGGRGNNANYSEANISDVSVFNAKLDDDAVTAMYNSGAPTDLTSNSGDYDYASNLIGYWKFQEGSGTSIADDSSNSNNLTLYNSPTWDNGDAPS